MYNYFHSLYAVLVMVIVVPVTESVCVCFMISLSAAERAASSVTMQQRCRPLYGEQ